MNALCPFQHQEYLDGLGWLDGVAGEPEDPKTASGGSAPGSSWPSWVLLTFLLALLGPPGVPVSSFLLLLGPPGLPSSAAIPGNPSSYVDLGSYPHVTAFLWFRSLYTVRLSKGRWAPLVPMSGPWSRPQRPYWSLKGLSRPS